MARKPTRAAFVEQLAAAHQRVLDACEQIDPVTQEAVFARLDGRASGLGLAESAAIEVEPWDARVRTRVQDLLRDATQTVVEQREALWENPTMPQELRERWSPFYGGQIEALQAAEASLLGQSKDLGRLHQPEPLTRQRQRDRDQDLGR